MEIIRVSILNEQVYMTFNIIQIEFLILSGKMFIGEMALQRMTSRGLSRNDDANLEAAAGISPKRGMVLPFTPLAMSFDKVNYYVDMPQV